MLKMPCIVPVKETLNSDNIEDVYKGNKTI